MLVLQKITELLAQSIRARALTCDAVLGAHPPQQLQQKIWGPQNAQSLGARPVQVRPVPLALVHLHLKSQSLELDERPERSCGNSQCLVLSDEDGAAAAGRAFPHIHTDDVRQALDAKWLF